MIRIIYVYVLIANQFEADVVLNSRVDSKTTAHFKFDEMWSRVLEQSTYIYNDGLWTTVYFTKGNGPEHGHTIKNTTLLIRCRLLC